MIDIDLILQKRSRFQIPDRKKSRKKEKEKESDAKKIRANNCQQGF
jgi:hypothetical protein